MSTLRKCVKLVKCILILLIIPHICTEHDQFWDRRQIALLILGELINFYSPRNHQKTIGFAMIFSGKKLINSLKLA